MAVSWERENKVLKEKITEVEKSLQSYKEKYHNMFYENHANVEFIKDLKREHKEQCERIENDFIYKIEKLENTLDSVRKNNDDNLKIWSKANKDLFIQLQKVRNELPTPRNNSETEDLTEKFHKSESDLIELRKLLNLEKEKVLEMEKNFNAERNNFEKEKRRCIEFERKFGAERVSYEKKINSLELNAKMLLKQISDFEQLIILE